MPPYDPKGYDNSTQGESAFNPPPPAGTAKPPTPDGRKVDSKKGGAGGSGHHRLTAYKGKK